MEISLWFGMMMKDNIKKIEVNVYYYENSKGESVPDWELTTEEFEDRLQDIDEKIEMFWHFEYDYKPLEEDVESESLIEMLEMREKQIIANHIEDETIALA
ncbi:MAG: hypothetical protein H8E12_20785 [Rhodobacteraceae bacterium]|nr:hypothetical protein [Paracoccaceae bacterium]